MIDRRRRRSMRILTGATLTLTALALSTLAGCGAADTSANQHVGAESDSAAEVLASHASPTATTATSSTEGVPPGSTTAELAADREITDEGVVEAAIIILSTGDLDAALLDGRITEAEADAAIEALEAGTLARYVD